MIDSWTYRIHEGDCLDVMREMPGASVDLIITSPPYAERRKDTYGGVPASEYVEWFLPRAAEMRRLLKPTGSLVLNLKEGTNNGQRETYVMRLVLDMVDRGWRWIDTYCWAKIDPLPGRWNERLKDGWEPLYHLAPTESRVKFRRDQVRIAPSARTLFRLEHEIDRTPRESSTGSNFLVNKKKMLGDGKTVLPSNVLHIGTVGPKRYKHPAMFPEGIPEFFVRLLTVEGDVVLDPFSGSGTTYRVAQRAGRKPIGIEIKPEYVKQENPMLL